MAVEDAYICKSLSEVPSYAAWGHHSITLSYTSIIFFKKI
jgi:hypothetical protein